MYSLHPSLVWGRPSANTDFDWPAWDRFVETCPGGTFYHGSAWLRALRLGLGQDIRLLTLCTGAHIRAGAVVRHAARLGLCAARKPWGTGYNGVVAEGGLQGEWSRLLLGQLRRRYLHVRLVQAPEDENSTDAFGEAWHSRVAQTPILDVRDPAWLWESFDRRARQRVRKAAALGVSADESNDYAAFADLYRMTYARQGTSIPLRTAAIELTVRLAVESGQACLFSAKTAQGEAAAGLLVGFDARRAYFALAASHPVHRKTDAVTFLWWRAIEACSRLVNEVDLVGHGVGSIDQFKHSFSPRMVAHLDAHAYGKGAGGCLFRLAQRARSFCARRERGQ